MKKKFKQAATFVAKKLAPKMTSDFQSYRLLRHDARQMSFLAMLPLKNSERFQRIQNSCFFTQQLESEFVFVMERVQAIQPHVIVEIGAFRGGTLSLFSQIAPSTCRLLSIDIAFTTPQVFAFKAFASQRQEVRCIAGNSSSPKTLKQVSRWLGPTLIDVLFIDGDHSYRGVKADFEAYSSRVRKGGLIVFHDIVEDYATRFGKATSSYTGGVPKFWRELVSSASFVSEECVANREQDGFGVGILIKS